jgi:hypothetical protein
MTQMLYFPERIFHSWIGTMGTIQTPSLVKLIAAIMFQESAPIDQIVGLLETRFGKIQAVHGPMPFTWTDYYAKEMGSALFKSYCCFERLISREDLPAIKRWTNDLEQEFARQGTRIVNIDPGYLSRDKLVLASTKDFYHRLYLGQGIFGEVTIHFRQGKYRNFSWTYPDFKEEKLQEFLMKQRAGLVGELRKGNPKSEIRNPKF